MYFQEGIHERLIQIYHQQPANQEWLEGFLNKKEIGIEELEEISKTCDVCLEWIATGRK